MTYKHPATDVGWSVLNAANTQAARTALDTVTKGYVDDADTATRAYADTATRAYYIRSLRNLATVWSDLITNTHIQGGAQVSSASRPVSVSTPTAITSGGTNLLSGLLPIASLVAYSVPIPAGLSYSGNRNTVNGFSGDSVDMTWKTSSSSSQNCGGLIFSWQPPAVGNYLLSFTVECPSSTSEQMLVQVLTFREAGGVSYPTVQYPVVVYVSGEHSVRRVTTRVIVNNTLDRLQIQVYGATTADIDQSARIIMSDFMLVPETFALPIYGGLLSVPPYSRTTSASSDITLSIPVSRAGEHMVLVKTAERGWIASRGTLTESNSLASLFPNANITVQEIVAVPSDKWMEGDLDVIVPPLYKSVEWHYTDSTSAAGFRRSPADLSLMVGTPIGQISGTNETEVAHANQIAIGRPSLNRFECRGGDTNTRPPVALGSANDRCEAPHGSYVPPDTDVWISTWTRLSAYMPSDQYAITMQLKSMNLSPPTRGNPDLSVGPLYGQGLFGCVFYSDRNLITAVSGTGSTATITLSQKPYSTPAVGSSIVVTGVTPSGYNGTYTVTAASSSAPYTISYACAATGSLTNSTGYALNKFVVSTPKATYVPDKWHRLVMKLRWSGTLGGSLNWWWDGQLIYSNNAVELGYTRGSIAGTIAQQAYDGVGTPPGDPMTLHRGCYRQYSTTPLIVDYQHFEVSTSSLQSRITAPLPI